MRKLCFASSSLCALAFPGLVNAANALYTTGFGASSASMSGADLAISRDISALTTNPAGLAWQKGSRADGWIATYYTNRMRHEDEFGNQERLSNSLGMIGGGGYAAHVPGHNLVAGVGLFVQGGVGYVYDDLETAFGTRDDASAIFSVVKLSSGLSWPINEQLGVGLTADVLYANVRQKLFPETSFFDQSQSEAPFFGSRVDGLSDVAVGGRIGMQYKFSERWSFAAAYAPPVRFVLKGGTVTVNYEALGMGRVRYEKARMDGLKLPQEAGLALAWKPQPSLLMTMEVMWFNWDSSLNSLRLQAADPDRPAPAAVIENSANVDLHDQVVFNFGTEWVYSERLVLRGGYAHGRNPQPRHTLSPILPLIPEDDFSLGLGYKLTPQWELNCGLEYQPFKSLSYTNPQLPFGENARISNEAIILHLMIGRRW